MDGLAPECYSHQLTAEQLLSHQGAPGSVVKWMESVGLSQTITVEEILPI